MLKRTWIQIPMNVDRNSASHVPVGTTYERLRDAKTLQDFVSKLYEFGLEQSALLPTRATEEQLADACAEFVTRLLAATQEALNTNRDDEIRTARSVLKTLRLPASNARHHTQSGFRKRLKQAILKDLGYQRERQVEDIELHATIMTTQEPSGPMTGIADLPPELLEDVRNRLRESWTEVAQIVLKKVCKTTATTLIRRQIIEVFFQATLIASTGILADELERLLNVLSPKNIREKLKKLSLPKKASERIRSQSKIDQDIRLVRAALIAEIPILREKEKQLRSRVLAFWAMQQLKNNLRNATKSPSEEWRCE